MNSALQQWEIQHEQCKPNRTTAQLLTVRLAHIIRWVLEMLFVWGLVLPETGPWTCFVLTMITVGLEWEYFLRYGWSATPPPRKG